MKKRILLISILSIILIVVVVFMAIKANAMVREKYTDKLAEKEQILKEREKELELATAEEESKQTIESIELSDDIVDESIIIDGTTLSIKAYVDVNSEEEALSIANFLKENLVENNKEMLNRKGVTSIEVILKGTEKSWKLNDSNSIEAV